MPDKNDLAKELGIDTDKDIKFDGDRILEGGRDTGYRRDSDGAVYKESWSGKDYTGRSYDAESGKIYEGSGYSKSDTGKRIDPSSGNLQENSFMGYYDVRTERVMDASGATARRGLFGNYSDFDLSKDKPSIITQSDNRPTPKDSSAPTGRSDKRDYSDGYSGDYGSYGPAASSGTAYSKGKRQVSKLVSFLAGLAGAAIGFVVGLVVVGASISAFSKVGYDRNSLPSMLVALVWSIINCVGIIAFPVLGAIQGTKIASRLVGK